MPCNTEDARAVIDLGTNTMLMVTGRRSADGSIEILDDAHAIARLGKDVDAQRRIGPETMARVCSFLHTYRRRARSFGARHVTAFGTSALRDAANKAAFIAHVKSETGIDLVELSGAEEARLTFAGAGFGIDLPHRYGVLDIGGGSTELALGSKERVEQFQSVDVGAVRITERYFSALPPSSALQQQAASTVREELGSLFPYPSGVALVGVAGTVTTLEAIDRKAERFDAEELNGHFLARSRVEELSAYLLSLSLAETRNIPQVDEARADIIAAGALILTHALRMLGCPGLIVSTRGTRYGLLERAFSESGRGDDSGPPDMEDQSPAGCRPGTGPPSA